MSFHVETIPNRNSRPTILIRKARREDGRLRKKTIANLTELPPHVVAGVRALIRGGVTVARPEDAFAIHRAWPHGHVAAALGTLRGDRPGPLAAPHSRAHARSGGGRHCRAHRRSRLQARHRAGPLAGNRVHPASARRSASGPVTGNEMLDMLDWLLRAPAPHRAQPGQQASQGRHAGAVRRQLQLSGGEVLPARRLRPQPRRQEGQEADRLRPSVRHRRLPGRGGGVFRQHVRSADPPGAGREDPAAASASRFPASPWSATAA